jgi:hypothetical protein
MNIAHITQRLAGCHGTGCATHQGKGCDCGAVVVCLAKGYEGGTMISDPHGDGAKISLHYGSVAEAEAAFNAISNLIDAELRKGERP